jgi:hypothetical protein
LYSVRIATKSSASTGSHCVINNSPEALINSSNFEVSFHSLLANRLSNSASKLFSPGIVSIAEIIF